MDTNEAGKSEKFFQEFGRKMDGFLKDVKDAGGKLEKDLQQKYEELKASAERLKKEAENKERWKEVEEGLKRAGKEMENALKAAFKKPEK